MFNFGGNGTTPGRGYPVTAGQGSGLLGKVESTLGIGGNLNDLQGNPLFMLGMGLLTNQGHMTPQVMQGLLSAANYSHRKEDREIAKKERERLLKAEKDKADALKNLAPMATALGQGAVRTGLLATPGAQLPGMLTSAPIRGPQGQPGLPPQQRGAPAGLPGAMSPGPRGVPPGLPPRMQGAPMPSQGAMGPGPDRPPPQGLLGPRAGGPPPGFQGLLGQQGGGAPRPFPPTGSSQGPPSDPRRALAQKLLSSGVPQLQQQGLTLMTKLMQPKAPPKRQIMKGRDGRLFDVDQNRYLEPAETKTKDRKIIKDSRGRQRYADTGEYVFDLPKRAGRPRIAKFKGVEYNPKTGQAITPEFQPLLDQMRKPQAARGKRSELQLKAETTAKSLQRELAQIKKLRSGPNAYRAEDNTLGNIFSSAVETVFGEKAGKAVSSTKRQQYVDATSAIVRKILRIESGAAISIPERAEYLNGLIPGLTDNRATAQSKMARLEAELQNFLALSGNVEGADLDAYRSSALERMQGGGAGQKSAHIQALREKYRAAR